MIHSICQVIYAIIYEHIGYSQSSRPTLSVFVSYPKGLPGHFHKNSLPGFYLCHLFPRMCATVCQIFLLPVDLRVFLNSVSCLMMHLPIRLTDFTLSFCQDWEYGLVSSVRRALASKLRGPGFKSRLGTVGGPVTIIMWGAQPGWKLALS